MASSDRLFSSLMLAGSAASAAPQAYAAEAETSRQLSPGDQSPRAHYLRDRTMSHRDWLLANEERRRLQERWASYFGDMDVLITPAAPTAAVPDQANVPMSERHITVDGQRRAYWEQTTWLNLAGLVHLPAATVPLGRTREGLPLGIQLIGAHLGDRTVIKVAGLLGELRDAQTVVLA
ncbi:amidase family protein [Kitasatospora sp. DSM 101779]|uniref:amidase family protein n=1 Tax=Kitasatospora sp. DSM 101779 TaxID=2853165 RepID=UPI0021DAD62C|nr:amidase family protein [Kitasatospora sp. DSM 101779]MCU7820155.1 hypothetical protein [Kitasatospora sp. DSM 101779]